MTGIGNKHQVASLSNCFVIGHDKPADSYGGIMKIDQEQVQLMKRRGGVGHDLSHIRPKGSSVLNSALTSTGIIPFMERYSNSTREVAQDGRRGALMLSISIKHPDAEEFIDAKMKKGKVTGANVSVKIDNEFMDAVINNKKYVQQFPIDSKNPEVKKEIDAQKLWEKIVHNAWKSAEPGILFWDTITKESVPDCYSDFGYKTASTNPCGEIPLCPYDSCRLLALNLYGYVDNPFTEKAIFNFNLFKEHVHHAQRIMDDIIDLELEKIDAIINKINNDPEDQEIKRVEKLYRDMLKNGRRNIALLTIAPTGTTSLMTQTTSGIEPVFSPVYKRRRKVNPNDNSAKVSFVDDIGDAWEEYNVFHHKFVEWLVTYGYKPDEIRKYDDNKLQEVIKKSPYFKATSSDIDWLSKVRMQGEIQKWVDHSISVTINLPKSATEELVDELYVTAWESGCKGVTVYREGSRSGVLLTSDEKNEEEAKKFKRPKVLDAEIIRFKNNDEKWIAFVGLKDSKPYEIFTGMADEEMFPIPKSINKGYIIKNRDDKGVSRYDFQYVDKFGYKNTLGGLSHMFNKEFWNYAKLISSVLRHGMPLTDVVNLVSSLRLDSDTINTWKNGVDRALKRYIPDGTKAKKGQCCPECGSEELIYQEGCLICTSCGSSRCG